MEIVIEKINNGYRQTITDTDKGKMHIRRTNSIRKIESLIADLPRDPLFVEVNNKDIKVFYPNHQTLILKKYQKNLTSQVYLRILKSIDEDTPYIKNVKKNNRKLAVLALTTVVLTSSLIGVASFGHDKDVDTESLSASSQYVHVEIPVTTDISSNDFPEHDIPEVVESSQPKLIDEENFDLDQRILQTKQIINHQIVNNDNIPIATRMDEYTINKIVNFINSDDGIYTFQMTKEFGIDPYTFICLMMTESSLDHENSIPGGNNYNGFGVGICQLESPSGQEITAFNYSTNQNETIYETMENAIDKRSNIKMGIMRYQVVLERYHGNEKLALQAHNFGYGLVDLIVQIYADEKGVSFDEIVDNLKDTGWLKYVIQASNDPVGFANSLDINKYSNYSKTIEYLKNWQYGNYGNSDYLKDLYSYYLGIYSSNIVNGNIVQTNLTNNEVIKVSLTDINENDYIRN